MPLRTVYGTRREVGSSRSCRRPLPSPPSLNTHYNPAFSQAVHHSIPSWRYLLQGKYLTKTCRPQSSIPREWHGSDEPIHPLTCFWILNDVVGVLLTIDAEKCLWAQLQWDSEQV